MTRARVNQLMDLVAEANRVGWATVQAELKFGENVVVHVFDARFDKKKHLSMYYESEKLLGIGGKLEKNPNKKRIITLLDPHLDAAEHYLRSIIRWYKEEHNVNP